MILLLFLDLENFLDYSVLKCYDILSKYEFIQYLCCLETIIFLSF